MDGRRTKKIRQKLSGSIEIDYQIASTRFFSTSRRRRSSQIPRHGINISFRIHVFFALVNSNMAKFLAKRRWSQEEVPILRESQFNWNSSVLSSNPRPFWVYTYWSYIARQRVVAERFRRAHLSRWKLPRLALCRPVWIDSGRERRQEKEACGVLNDRKSDIRWSAQTSRVRHDEFHNCSVQKSLESTPKCSITVYWVWFEGCSDERIALLSNTMQRNHPLQHLTCDMHRESGIHEVRRRILQQSVFVSKITAKSCTQGAFVSWTSGSFQFWVENILRPSKQRERRVRGNPLR